MIRCTIDACREPAVFKLAARWEIANVSELKTYEFSCACHLPLAYRRAEARWLAFEPKAGERLFELGIYRKFKGRLTRDRAIEARLSH
jgi:hypothetical protein